MQCERCNKETKGYELFDYCATCGKNLCDEHMKAGCCGVVPAASGMQATDEAECKSCMGYGHIDDATGRPTLNRNARKCGDCRGTGRAN